MPSLKNAGAAFPAFAPTYGVPDTLAAREIQDAPVDGALIDLGLRGFLRPQEALKLYELAYHLRGDTIELGTAWGLSTTILARAKRDAGRAEHVLSIELNPEHADEARRVLAEQGVSAWAQVLIGEAHEVASRLARKSRRFSFAFVDHDHRLEPTRHACRDLVDLLVPSGLALFHDCNDERHRTEDYGVLPGVREALDAGWFHPVTLTGSALLVQRPG